MRVPKSAIWGLWIVSGSCLTAWLVVVLYSDDRSLFLIGQTTLGHHQIELACESCHTKPFGGTAALQQACLNCHAAELKEARDSHPKSKFTDPRNADRVAALDARFCVTCHREHRPGITLAMGLTLPDDYCFKCHQTIGKERPSHKGLAFNSCASGGCHNFHDNRALYEDFLAAHLNEPNVSRVPAIPVRAWSRADPAYADRIHPALDRSRLSADETARAGGAILAEWEASQHAEAGVGCNDCHRKDTKGAGAAAWNDRPGQRACARCHASETSGFLAGRHGMRLSGELKIAMTPMTPSMARIPMKKTASDKTLGCATCHRSHGFDTRRAAVEACQSCHDDTHTRNYRDSPHYALWQAEVAGRLPAGRGVSCATCHLPREVHRADGGDRVLVQHNQNLNLRPNEKMIRTVCLACHGLGFTLDSLADADLVRSNFSRRPTRHVKSLDWVRQRQKPNHDSPPPTTTGERK